jgi:hypothetical protein
MGTVPEDYAFSSYRFYSQGCKDLLITPNPIYVALSEKEENRWKLYINFVVDNILFASDKIVNCRYIGTDSFITKMEQRYGLLNNQQPRGGRRSSRRFRRHGFAEAAEPVGIDFGGDERSVVVAAEARLEKWT